ncbi:MAG TPA: AMP-binding protein [Candidatus Binatia bacterium]|nr:AMP-binding protein [Candidatus Binatia bacterium]
MPHPAPLLPTTPAFLRLQAERCGNAGGLAFGGRAIGYAELAAAVDDLARWLAVRGIGAGDAVGVMAANVPAMPAVLYALWGLGAVAVPIGARSTAAEAARLLAHARARALVCDPARADTARAAAAAAGAAAYVCRPDLPLAPRLLRRAPRRWVGTPRPPRLEGVAVVAYTSGSTGAPKGVVLTHANLWWATLACAQARGDGPEGVGACLSPLTHTPVLVSHLLCRILLGATAVLVERFDVAAVLDAVERHGVTDLPLIGGMVFDVVARGAVSPAVRRTIRKVSVGGAPTPMDAKRALAGIFPEAELIEAYGQTESTDGVSMTRGTAVLDRPGTVGRMNPYVRVAIRRADGALAEPDEEGEIVVAGPTVMRGYLRDAAATRAAIRDGWLHTGDVGRRDADGWFYVTGRVKDLIITGGENVSPVEVETVLRAHPDVADVAVIGTPHPRWGEQVTAVVVRRPGAVVDGAALAAFAGARLAGYKKPRRVEFVAALPRNAANKVQTHLLKAEFGG